MAFRPPKNIALSRIFLFVLTALYSLLSTILLISSFVAASKSFQYANRLQAHRLEDYLRPALYFVVGHAGMLVSLLTGITALNILKLPEKKRLLTTAQGVGMERIGIYVLRVVHLTLILYVLLIWIGWKSEFFAHDLTAIFAAQFRDNYTDWRASTTTVVLLHLTAYDYPFFELSDMRVFSNAYRSVGVTIVGLAAAFARPTPLESSLRPVSPGTIDPEMPATSRV